MSRLSILLHGAGGRMGRAIREALASTSDVTLAACVSRRSRDEIGPSDAAWLSPEALARADGLPALPGDIVVIDVSLAEGTDRLLSALEASPRALVAATTGLSARTEERIAALARQAPVLRARNLSLGIAVLSGFLRALPDAARESFDADIVEHHHAGKKDAPSGTAAALAEAMGDWRSPRRKDGVRTHSIRGGTVPGTHEVILSGEGETLSLTHAVSDRAVFARGAIRAARFLRGRAPGLYTFEDVLTREGGA